MAILFILISALFLNTNDVQAQLNMEMVKHIFAPLPDKVIDTSIEQNKFKVELGKKLYFEKQLSLNNDISCNSCHKIDGFGVDNEPTSPGHKGQRGGRNSPTTFNSALNFAQFWDGRAPDLEAQAIGPILNPIEMAMPNEKAVMDKLAKIKGMKEEFAKAFKGEKAPFSYKNVGVAIAAFEKLLLTPSPFDSFLKGDENALTTDQKVGLETFMKVGCTNCHGGVLLGGEMYQKMGLVKEYPTTDLGRFEVTKKERNKFQFKVPMLRNIVHTAPYFHDGKVKTLEEAIKIMGEYQLGKNLTEQEIQSIKKFLESLSGEAPKI